MMNMDPQQTFGQRQAARLEELLWRKDFEFCEIISGLAALSWGIALSMPWNSFGTSPAFAMFHQYVPEWFMALLMISLGLLQLVGLFFEWYRARRWSCQLATGIWAGISVSLAMGNPWGTAVAMYPIFVIVSGWAFMRIKRIAVDEQ